jgi:hypothetical protein
VGTTSAERMRLNRRRRRQGKHHIKLLVNEDEVDFLMARGYPVKRTDNPRSQRRSLLTSPIRSLRAHERPNASLRGPADRAADRGIDLMWSAKG